MASYIQHVYEIILLVILIKLSNYFRIYVLMAFICDVCSEFGCTQMRICLYFPQYESLLPLSKLSWMTSILIIIIDTLFFLKMLHNIFNCALRNFQWCTNIYVWLPCAHQDIPYIVSGTTPFPALLLVHFSQCLFERFFFHFGKSRAMKVIFISFSKFWKGVCPQYYFNFF